MSQFFRQGDVLILPVVAIPDIIRPVEAEDGRLVVARGEKTGHHHSLPNLGTVALFRDEASGGLFLNLSEAAPVEHQEHTALTIPPGKYEVRLQTKYDPDGVTAIDD